MKAGDGEKVAFDDSEVYRESTRGHEEWVRRVVPVFFFFFVLKSNNPTCGSYAMAGGADASGRISCTKSIGNTTRSDTRYGITPLAKVLD